MKKTLLTLILLACFGIVKADIKDFNFTDYNFYGEFSPQVKPVNDSLVLGDTTATFPLSGSHGFILTIQDSSNSKTDSVKCYLMTSPQSAIGIRYSLLAMHELSQLTTTTNISLLIPGDGVTSSYVFNSTIPIYGVYVVRVNVGGVTGAVGYPYKTSIAIIED